ncbi:hypothetical protein FGG08_003253 [Glutinoglossum americanum]|uniref:Major facilitator superfamily (MFS) profile domain-containing protein n=1 Tax=Glutinoglossum americanum TaxID=1670608 RepID=A0A9P8I801_9PEZI|nr:hypothetical protein FGG08_003253 [Glutinoglossum americanum]
MREDVRKEKERVRNLYRLIVLSMPLGTNMEKELEANIAVPLPVHQQRPQNAASTDSQLSADIEKILPSSDSSSSSSITTPSPLDWHTTPLNPYNWPLSKRIHHILVPALYGFTISFSSSVYTPGIPSLQHEFHISTTVALLGLSLFTLGLAFGPIIAAPLSETYGRKVVYLVSMPVFVVFVICGGTSREWGGVLAFRVLAGVFGSPVLAVGAGTIADLWAVQDRGVATSLFLLAPFAGPSLGPVIGGFAAQRGWRWTHWTILFFAGFSYLLALMSSETYKKIILRRHAQRIGQPLPSKGNKPSPLARANKFLTATLSRPLHMLVTEPIVFFFSLYVSFAFGVLFAFFAAFPLVFQRVYGFDGAQVGLTFLAIGTGCMLAVVTVVIADLKIYQKLVRKDMEIGGDGIIRPEYRLYPAMVGSAGLPISLFWFAWTARSDIHWASPVAAAIPFAWGNLCIFELTRPLPQTSAAMYMIDTYSAPTAASALAANGMARYVFGAAFPLFTIPMYNHLGTAWATSLLGFLSLVLLPVPWVLWAWGPRIRQKSGYETINI